MPNHIHILWEIIKMNGKEKPSASFHKYTSHLLTKLISDQHPKLIQELEVDKKDRKHLFWKPDPLAIKIFSREMAEQKLKYIHQNPLQEHWDLAQQPEDYQYSSARFYLTENKQDFEFLKDYRDRL
jgi:REP element-mobilizing transposase RayT